jgi:hypothetical protein
MSHFASINVTSIGSPFSALGRQDKLRVIFQASSPFVGQECACKGYFGQPCLHKKHSQFLAVHFIQTDELSAAMLWNSTVRRIVYLLRIKPSKADLSEQLIPLTV